MNRDDKTWNPWHGCKKCSEGCQNCYMFFLDRERERDGSEIHRNKTEAELPIKKDRAGNYKIKAGEFVRVCMTSDFFLEEADEWRDEAWEMMRRRPDVTFSLLTKRAHRIAECLPADWGDGWDNVYIAVSCENQERADERIPALLDAPAKHKWVSLKPFIGAMDLDGYLATGNIETVLAGGESYEGMRPLHYEWVKKIYDQCIAHEVEFIFGQTGNVFVKDGRTYHIRDVKTQMDQALASGLQNRRINFEEERKMTREGIYEFIGRQKTSILSSIGEDGFPATRALIQPVLIDGNDIYFATYTASRKVKHYRANPKACVYFYEKGRSFSGVEIKGNMTVLNDQSTKDRFWKPFFTRFYKQGKKDPNYCILKFTGFEAQWFTDQKTETIKL